MLPHTKTRGVWGHAPPEKFCNLQPLRLLVVASETTLTVNIVLLMMYNPKVTLICKFPPDSIAQI